jgi:hypothetical protein
MLDRPNQAGPTSGPKTATSCDAPQDDWVSLKWAPFYCGGGRLATSPEPWASAIEEAVTSARGETLFLPPECEINFHRQQAKWHRISFEAGGLWTVVFPCRFITSALPNHPPDAWRVICDLEDPGRVLCDAGWRAVPPAEQERALWHRDIIEALALTLEADLVWGLRIGSLHMMARKNSVLAPFERITYDQWQYFDLEDQSKRPAPRRWYTAHRSPNSWRDPSDCRAIGPAGERLFAIYIAPGAEPSRDESPSSPRARARLAEKQCQHYLRDLLQEYPDNGPAPLDVLAEVLMKDIDGLSGRGFRRALGRAQEETGNYNWSESGRPRKSRQEPPQSE